MQAKRVLVGLLVLLIALTAVSVVSAQDQNPDRLTVDVLESGDVIRDTFEGPVNAHLYVFLGSADDEVSISMIPADDSSLDPYLVLLGAGGEVYAADDDSGEKELSALIDSFVLPTDGAYFILATSYNLFLPEADLNQNEDSPELQEYSVTVQGNTLPEDIENPDEFEFKALQMEIGEDNVLEITPEEPVFYVTFTGKADDTVTITTGPEGEDEVDTKLLLFDASGELIAMNDDFEGLDFYSSIQNFELPSDGLYLVFATSFRFYEAYQDGWDYGGSFTISISG